jgi:ABC-2 type transport system ATP-binding protein
LSEVLQQAGATVSGVDGDALTVTGRTTAEVGSRAFATGIELHELRAQSSGLEEIYFQLTAGQEQFAAPPVEGPGAEGAAR